MSAFGSIPSPERFDYSHNLTTLLEPRPQHGNVRQMRQYRGSSDENVGARDQYPEQLGG